MNSGIYKMGFVKKNPVLLRKVDERKTVQKFQIRYGSLYILDVLR